jgi:hypothetical protein
MFRDVTHVSDVSELYVLSYTFFFVLVIFISGGVSGNCIQSLVNGREVLYY